MSPPVKIRRRAEVDHFGIARNSDNFCGIVAQSGQSTSLLTRGPCVYEGSNPSGSTNSAP